MKTERIILISVVFFLGCLIAYLYVNPSQRTEIRRIVSPQTPSSPLEIESSIKKIHVIQGHEFDIFLGNGKRIHAFLLVKTPSEAKERVVKFMNSYVNPRVIIKQQLKDSFLVDIIVNDTTISKSTLSLTQWLENQNLIWEM